MAAFYRKCKSKGVNFGGWPHWGYSLSSQAWARDSEWGRVIRNFSGKL